MPLVIIFKFLFSLLSLIVLGTAVYFLWQWYDADLVLRSDGVLVRVRTDWHLWVGGAALALSILGRPILTPLLAQRDTDPTKPERAAGRIIAGATGSNLYVEEVGEADAPVVILTHGWAMDSTIWNYAKRDLSRACRVISWDLPGMGKSKPASPSAISVSEFARDLLTIIELAGTQKVVLVGHSIGGMTIQTLARDYPEIFAAKVAGTVLVNTTYTNPLKTMILSGLAQAIRWPLLEPAMRLGILLQPLVWLSAWQSYLSGAAHVANRLGFGKFVTHSQLNHTTLLSTRNAPGNIHRGNLAMFRWDATHAMERVQTPILILSGDKDIVTKPQAGGQIAADCPTGLHRVVEGVNHMGFLERPDIYNSAISDFVRSVQPKATPAGIVH